jgi:MSHA biogenesis protein MshJ
MTALNALANRLGALAERLDALSLRERGLIFGAGVALIYIAAQMLFLGPITTRAQHAEQRLATSRQHMVAIDAATADMANDPGVAAAARNGALKGRLALLDSELRTAAQGYVTPDRVADMLREILTRQQGLQLVSLSNLPVESLSHPQAAAPGVDLAADDRGPFLHPVEMVVEGDYVSVVAYLRALEAMPWRIHWQQLELTAGDYPVNRVRIVIGALSLSRDWMSI